MASGFRSLALLGLGIAAMGIHGSVAATDAPDGMAADASGGITAAGALAEGADGVVATAAAPIAAAASLTDGPERAAATGTSSIAIGGGVIDSGDISASSVSTVTPRGFGSVAVLPLSVGSLSISGISGFANLVDSNERAAGSAGNGVLLTSINDTSAWRITATPDLIVGDRLELLSAIGGPVSDITINSDATFSLVAGSTVTSFVLRVWSITDQDWGAGATQFIEVFIASSLAERGDRLQASAGPVIGASVALVDRHDNVAASSLFSLGFVGALRDSQESLAAAIAAAIGAAASVQDANDRAQVSAAITLSMTAAAQDLPDLVSSLSGTPQGVLFSALHDETDAAAGAGVLAVAVAGSLEDQAERISAGITLPVAISSGVLDLGDGIVSVLAVARSADVALRDSELQLLANAAIAIVADFTGLDRDDILRSGTSLILAEKAGGFVAELVVANRLFTLSVADRSFTLSPSTGKKL